MMQNAFAELDIQSSSMHKIENTFFTAMAKINYSICLTDEEKVFVRDCELKMIPYYQRAIDENDMPIRTIIVDVKKGRPIYANNCKEIEIFNKVLNVENCCDGKKNG